MKKLMFAAATVAVAGGAFSAPLVYDYKASAKHMYLKEVNVRVAFGGFSQTFRVYQKVQKSATLRGFLIVDADGATSPTINAAKLANPTYNNGGKWANGTPAQDETGATPPDFGRNRAFLVVQNSKAEADVRFPKIIPSVLDAKWIDTKFSVVNGARNPATSGIAEGYLYSGGNFGIATRPQLDLLMDAVNSGRGHVTDRVDNGGALLANARMIGDYAWTSLWLFGKYNMPTGLTGLWDISQGAIDTGASAANLPLTNLFAPGGFFFHDTWMNGSGFGKYSAGKVKEPCCGYASAASTAVLETLSGNLKGGLLLCTENGTYFQNGIYNHLAGGIWEDQFFCARMGTGVAGDPTNGAFSAGDAEPQQDLWQDGELELNTSDCISGTWSIKLTNRNLATVNPITRDDLNDGLGLAVPAAWAEDVPGLRVLLSTIKGAAFALNSKTIFANGQEIYSASGDDLAGLEQQPFITPAFALYYDLLNFK